MSKKTYEVKEKVWIHMGERKLVGGRVVEIFTLDHLKENYTPEINYYVVEVSGGIDKVYEVRTFEQISPSPKGPIPLFRREDVEEGERYLKKIGIVVPKEGNVIFADDLEDTITDPSPEEINAAIDRVSNEQSTSTKPAKKRFYHKKKRTSIV